VPAASAAGGISSSARLHTRRHRESKKRKNDRNAGRTINSTCAVCDDAISRRQNISVRCSSRRGEHRGTVPDATRMSANELNLAPTRVFLSSFINGTTITCAATYRRSWKRKFDRLLRSERGPLAYRVDKKSCLIIDIPPRSCGRPPRHCVYGHVIACLRLASGVICPMHRICCWTAGLNRTRVYLTK
jgi:hypothetical protein